MVFHDFHNLCLVLGACLSLSPTAFVFFYWVPLVFPEAILLQHDGYDRLTAYFFGNSHLSQINIISLLFLHFVFLSLFYCDFDLLHRVLSLVGCQRLFCWFCYQHCFSLKICNKKHSTFFLNGFLSLFVSVFQKPLFDAIWKIKMNKKKKLPNFLRYTVIDVYICLNEEIFIWNLFYSEPQELFWCSEAPYMLDGPFLLIM